MDWNTFPVSKGKGPESEQEEPRSTCSELGASGAVHTRIALELRTLFVRHFFSANFQN